MTLPVLYGFGDDFVAQHFFINDGHTVRKSVQGFLGTAARPEHVQLVVSNPAFRPAGCPVHVCIRFGQVRVVVDELHKFIKTDFRVLAFAAGQDDVLVAVLAHGHEIVQHAGQ